MNHDLSIEPKKRPWLAIGAGVLVITGGVLAFTMKGGDEKPKPKKAPDTISIVLPPPPPPPPPPKPEPPKPEEVKQEMVQQEKIEEETPPPPQAAPEPPAPDITTNLLGNGPGSLAYGDGKHNGPGGNGNGTIGGARRGGKYDAYAGQVQSSLRDALGRNAATRNATFSGTFRVWVDGTGRITRAKGPDGNADTALTGLQLPAAPPSDMPMPINLRISASKPVSASR